MTAGHQPGVGTEDTVQNYFALQLFQLQQHELELQARDQGLTLLAARVRRRNRRAARQTRALRVASEAVAQVGSETLEARSPVPAHR
jgi:hypothetical protein